MLIEFRVENHRSIRQEQAITLEAARGGASDDPIPREVESDRLLPVAALYGANASGKSNLLAALAFMRDAVLLSHRVWPPDGGVPRDPFAWGPASKEPSLFEVTLRVQGVRYQYGFVADDERFLEEWLFAWPKGRKQIWLERDAESFKFGDHLQGENKLVEQFTRPNALFLSVAVQHRHEQLAPLFRWFGDMRTVNLRGRRLPEPSPTDRWLLRGLETPEPTRQASLFGPDDAGDPRLDAFRELLQAADVGIVDLKAHDHGGDSGPGRWPRRRILLRHRSSVEDAWLPLEEESQGTRTLFRLGAVMLDALWTGALLVVDELEASLHPLLSLHIVRQFNDPRLNPKNAQLLFTTHDTNLLGTTTGDPALRRDQVWLTEKDDSGATSVYPLTDYKARKSENLERGYLQGRYGAIPFLGVLAPARE